VIRNSSVVPANRVDVGGSRAGGSVAVSATLKHNVPGMEGF
jgi:hypothetical protein